MPPQAADIIDHPRSWFTHDFPIDIPAIIHYHCEGAPLVELELDEAATVQDVEDQLEQVQKTVNAQLSLFYQNGCDVRSAPALSPSCICSKAPRLTGSSSRAVGSTVCDQCFVHLAPSVRILG